MSKQKHYYTDEKNAQIVIALLKAHGIRRVIASPGTTHMAFLGSIQYDPWFKIWSAIDERHAAFLAVGMATESGEPVVLTCTGATASRNYLPALTEAFYRKLPILAITSSQPLSRIGNLSSQLIDRSSPPKDTIKYAIHCSPVTNDAQFSSCELAVNRAILELTRHGGGTVHINLETGYSRNFTVKELPSVRKIERYYLDDCLPGIPDGAKIAVYIGDHKPFSEKEYDALNGFLKTHNAIAVCHASSSWYGERRIVSSLVCSQGIGANPKYADLKPDLIIDIGEMSNDYARGYFGGCAHVWRVGTDGEAKDRFGHLDKVFEMPESVFFSHYATGNCEDSYYTAWKDAYDSIIAKMPELPFSNLWIGQQLLPNLPENSVLHVGLSSTLQNWATLLQYVKTPTFCNVGTCGIDGPVSTMMGASFCNPDKIYFGAVGDLTFFYDMNSLGNRHVGGNFRLLVDNNGCGGLFHTPGHLQEQFGADLDPYQAAGGHFGNKSHNLLRHYASDLGFIYLCASTKEEFLAALPQFLVAKSDKPIVFECFTEVSDDAKAWGIRMSLDNYAHSDSVTQMAKSLVPSRVKNAIKALVK